MRFGRPTLRLGAAGFALLMATCAPTVRAGTLAESPLTDDTDSDAARDDGGALATETKATALGRLDPPCFPVSVIMWAPRFPGADTDVTGWGSVDRTARVEGRTCEVRGWAPIESCGRTIPAYRAN